LQHGNGSLLDAVNQDAFDRIHVLHNAGHEIACGAVIKPSERQLLDVRVKLAAQVEDDLLFKRVV
jgi:hypothetical protein